MRRPNYTTYASPLLFSRRTRLDEILIALAISGPTTREKIPVPFEVGTKTLLRLIDHGVLVRTRTRPRRYSLDTSNPLYPELRNLLLRLAGFAQRFAAVRSYDNMKKYSVGAQKLFGDRRATRMLLQLATGPKRRSELFAGQFDNKNLATKLAHWVKAGVIAGRRTGNRMTFSLNESFVGHRELVSLLNRVNQFFPELKDHAL